MRDFEKRTNNKKLQGNLSVYSFNFPFPQKFLRKFQREQECEVTGTPGHLDKKLFHEKINYCSWLRWYFSSRNWEIFLINNGLLLMLA